MQYFLPNLIFCNIHNDEKQIQYINGLLPLLREKGYNTILSEFHSSYSEMFTSFWSLIKLGLTNCFYFKFLMEQPKFTVDTSSISRYAGANGYVIEYLQFSQELINDILDMCQIDAERATIKHAEKLDYAMHVNRGDLMLDKILSFYAKPDMGVITIMGAMHCPYIKDKIDSNTSFDSKQFRFVFPNDGAALESYTNSLHKAALDTYGLYP